MICVCDAPEVLFEKQKTNKQNDNLSASCLISVCGGSFFTYHSPHTRVRWWLRRIWQSTFVLNISFESGGSGSCGNWYCRDAQGQKHQNITSFFSRSANPQSQVTTNTSCNVSIVGLGTNKGTVECVRVSLTRTFTHSAQRELAYHYCMRWDVRIFNPGSSPFHNHKNFTYGLLAEQILKTPCFNMASSHQAGGVEPCGGEAPYWGLMGLCCRWRLTHKNTECSWVGCTYRTSGWDSSFTAFSQRPSMRLFVELWGIFWYIHTAAIKFSAPLKMLNDINAFVHFTLLMQHKQ